MNGTLKLLTREANFLSLIGNIIVSFFGFAGFALLARGFPKELFGEWILYITAAAFVDMFRFGIVTTAMIRYLSGAGEEIHGAGPSRVEGVRIRHEIPGKACQPDSEKIQRRHRAAPPVARRLWTHEKGGRRWKILACMM